MSGINETINYANFFPGLQISDVTEKAKKHIEKRGEKTASGKKNGKLQQLNIRVDEELVKKYSATCRSMNVTQRAPLEKMLRRFVNKHTN